jgi:tRNA pseudouridine32 synthase / 23S rRNA pseudouridine746 synthase
LRRFQAAFEQRLVTKTYLAIVAGVPAETAGTITLPLAKESTREGGWRMVVRDTGKPASTDWRLLATKGKSSLIELRPHTGRTHQLRVHCAICLGYPIIGDARYGRTHPGGMMLHASALDVPRGDKPAIVAKAPFPQRFVELGYTHAGN